MSDISVVAEALRRSIVRRALEDIIKFDDDAAFIEVAKRRLLQLHEPNQVEGAPTHDHHSRRAPPPPASVR